MRSGNEKIDNEDRINNAGNIGIEYSIIFSEFIDDIEALKRVRFKISQSNWPEWPKNIYQSKELFLNF